MPPILQDLAVIAGTITASRAVLARYIALSTHRPCEWWIPPAWEPHPASRSNGSTGEGETAHPGRSPDRAVISKVDPAACLTVLSLVCFIMTVMTWVMRGLGFELPGGVSIWIGVGLFYLLGCVAFYVMLDLLFPSNTHLAIRRNQTDLKYTQRTLSLARSPASPGSTSTSTSRSVHLMLGPYTPSQALRVLLSFVIPALIIATSGTIGWLGYPVLAFAIIVAAVGSSRPWAEGGMGVKGVVGLNVVYLVIIALSYGYSLLDPTDPSDTDSHKDQNEKSVPPDWAIGLMMTFFDNILTFLPCTLIALTYRFEYTSLYPPTRTSSNPVAIVSPHHTCQLPITSTGLAAFSIATLAQNLMPKELQVMGRGLSIAGVCATAPCTILAIVGVSWRAGRLREWWEYREVWIPDIQEVRYLGTLLVEEGDGVK